MHLVRHGLLPNYSGQSFYYLGKKQNECIVNTVITEIEITCTDDCVCILVQILHALFEAPEAADATLQATLGTWILTTFTSATHIHHVNTATSTDAEATIMVYDMGYFSHNKHRYLQSITFLVCIAIFQ